MTKYEIEIFQESHELFQLSHALKLAFEAGSAFATGSHNHFNQTHCDCDEVVSFLESRLDILITDKENV